MDSRFLDMLLNRSDDTRVFIGQRIDVKLGGTLKKFINQYWAVRREANRGAHVLVEAFFIVNDGHRAAAKHVTRPDQDWITNLLGNLFRFFTRSRHSVFRLRNAQILEQRAKTFSIFSEINRVCSCADDRNACPVQTHRQVQWRLSAKLDNDSLRVLYVDDVHYVFKGERFEVETVGRVVIRRNGFRVAVDHDRLKARIPKGKGGMATTIVKFNSLADAIGPGAQDHDLTAIGRRCFVFRFVSRIQIRGKRFKLGAAGINAFIDRSEAQFFSVFSDFVLRSFSEICEPSIGQRDFLERSQKLRLNIFELAPFNSLLDFHYILELLEKPGIDAR